MATGSSKIKDKMCEICAPKQVIAITLCHGCQSHFCRKHFNEHRDKLSICLNGVIDLHDQILQDLRTRIDRTESEQPNNTDTTKVLQQVGEWEKTTTDTCHRVAKNIRETVKKLFDKTEENNTLMERLSSVAKELEEQQIVENFVEYDLDEWKRQLEILRNDINRPITPSANITIESQEIDWEKSIMISQGTKLNTGIEHYVLIIGDKGAGM